MSNYPTKPDEFKNINKQLYIALTEIEREYKWIDWIEHIPTLNFPNHWKVQIMPPFGGAIVRFRVRTKKDNWVSVFLDGYNKLGIHESCKPYWEIYKTGCEPELVLINETELLFKKIEEFLEKKGRKTIKLTKEQLKGINQITS